MSLGKITVDEHGEIYTCWCCGESYTYDSMYTWPRCKCMLTYCTVCGKCSQHCECEKKEDKKQ